ncbi:MAG TPA: DUF881 domain-containing protein [Candidatus Limnocylindrales bacterium]|nr:DUF881 domain-containing protein [Candidatus Limnocylindrales bacterium]
MRRRGGHVAVFGVAIVLGFLAVTQWRSQAANDGLTALSVQELGELVANLTTRNNQLRDEIRTLERQRDAVAAAVERGDSSAVQIRSDLSRVLGWSGALGVTGTGVHVIVEGPLPGDAVEELINELRNAGAEAISIGTIRVVPGVVVTGPAGNLVVTGIPLADPLELLAIGHQEILSGSMTRAGGPIAQFAARYPDVTITVNVADRLSLPATDRDLGPKLGRPRI